MSLLIKNLQVEFAETPLGLDEALPRISYTLESDRRGARQVSRRICVQEDSRLVWDSGIVAEAQCPSVRYAGEPLKPRTRYDVTVTVTDDAGTTASADTWFETGLMEEEIAKAFLGAEFIGPDETVLMAKVKSVFRYHAKFRATQKDAQIRFIFGANDPRLLDKNKNDYNIEGPNEIAYALDVSQTPAKIDIYRIGYCPEDSADTPIASFTAVSFDDPEQVLIGQENALDWHTIDFEVAENAAYTYIDGVKCDAVKQKLAFTPPGAKPGVPVYIEKPRQLNPAGSTDVTPYPMLSEFGYESAQGFELAELQIFNLRSPEALIYDAAADGSVVQGRRLIDATHTSAPMLRRAFTVKPGLKKARLYATARGIYTPYVNGTKVSDHWFEPGAGQYDAHLLYQTYDITDKLEEGPAAVGFQLSSGWWNESQTFSPTNYNYWGDRQSLLAQIVLTYDDGTEDVIVTEPASWKYCGEGPVEFAGFFYGEHFDGRRASLLEQFSCPDFDDSVWKAPIVVDPVDFEKERTHARGGFHMWPIPKMDPPKLVGYMGEPVRQIMTLTAQSVSEPRPGVYIYDMGQNLIGVPKLHLHGAAGTQAVIRFGEILYPYLPQYGHQQGMLLTENYRDAISTDRYTFRGDAEGEDFMPDQTFHGYRFVEITGVSKKPEIAEVQAAVLSSINRETGTFTCSDPLVNRFFQNVRWSQFANFVSIPTDCPQRNERMGWAGDAEVFARTATYNADVHNFYRRYLLWLRDCQLENGRYPDIAPVGGGFGGIEWGSAGIIVTYETYQQYGDPALIRENFVAMDRYIEFLKAQGTPGKLDNVGPLPDWLASDLSTDGPLLWNAVFAYDCKIMAEMATVIGETEKAAAYQALCDQIGQVWNETYLEPETLITRKLDGTRNNTQASYALPLEYGVILPENLAKVRENLRKITEEVGYTVTTGFVGTGPLNPALTEAGYADVAYKLITQTVYPSWLYPVTQGATTIWERWNSYTVENGFGGNNAMNSFNHYSLGAVCAWIYGYVLGIKRTEPGFTHFLYQPYMEGLDHAEGYFDSIFGRIESRWQITDTAYDVCFTIPVGSTATVKLPVGTVLEADGLVFEPENDRFQTTEALSGTYHVIIRK